MKRFLRHPISICALAVVLSLAGCGSVTETGNPYGGPDEPESYAEQGDEATYTNNAYGVTVTYSSSWGVQEVQGSCSGSGDRCPQLVIFSDGADPETTVTVMLSTYEGAPDALASYLGTQYPTFTFTEYNTGTMQGYVYDDPASGEHGGDAKFYAFLEGDVLIKILVEMFAGGEDGVAQILAGISVQ